MVTAADCYYCSHNSYERSEDRAGANPVYRYEELASFITEVAQSGTLPSRSRAPSLRQISKQRRIGLSTALKARSTFDSYHPDAIEGHSGSGPQAVVVGS